jgi:putative DNA primase/helicase
VEEGRRLSEGLVKQLTGGDTVRARFMRRDHFSITPTWLILYAVNHKPVVRGTDHAIWRRLLLVPFTVTISEPERGPDLGTLAVAEVGLHGAASRIGVYR